jgi:hypothetical protein
VNAWTGYGIIMAIVATTMSGPTGVWVAGIVASALGYQGLRQEREDRRRDDSDVSRTS